MTPEMLSYFSEELTRNASQGVRNIVSDVELLKGELTESWEEGDLQYATAYLNGGRSTISPGSGVRRATRIGWSAATRAPGRGRGDVDLCPPPRRPMAALRHPADLTRASRNR